VCVFVCVCVCVCVCVTPFVGLAEIQAEVSVLCTRQVADFRLVSHNVWLNCACGNCWLRGHVHGLV